MGTMKREALLLMLAKAKNAVVVVEVEKVRQLKLLQPPPLPPELQKLLLTQLAQRKKNNFLEIRYEKGNDLLVCSPFLFVGIYSIYYGRIASGGDFFRSASRYIYQDSLGRTRYTPFDRAGM